MTLNRHNGHPSLAGAELPLDGLDLVHLLQDHLRRHPEDVQTWQALQLMQTTPGVVEPLLLHL